MKHLRVLCPFLFLLVIAHAVNAQDVVEPEIGTIDGLKDMHRVYVICEDDDARATIERMLSGYTGVEVVSTPKTADFYLEFKNLTRDIAPGRGGREFAMKSQMRAFIVKSEDKTRVTMWTETETYDESGGFTLSATNEVNLTHHFINALQRARGEKKSSMRDLWKHSKKTKS
jgi:hypothetical protein